MKRYEISLWDNCSNGCSFCWTFNSPKAYKVSVEKQILAVQKAKSFIDTISSQDDVLITGGEIFDIININVKKELRWLFISIVLKMESNEIDLFYINTNLY